MILTALSNRLDGQKNQQLPQTNDLTKGMGKMEVSRRNFLKTVGVGLTAGVVTGGIVGCGGSTASQTKQDGPDRLNLGLTSYTFRRFSLDDAIAMTTRLGLKHISLKSMHLPLDSTPAELKAAVAKVRDAGLDLYGGGVVYMSSEDQVNQAFEYAKQAGFRVMIGVPNRELLDLVNQKIKDYDFKLAIHNHGPGDEHYPSPGSVYEKIQNLDEKIGLCMDIGHTQRLGLDPAEEAIKYADRLYDVHMKDVTSATKDGQTVQVGRGVIDIPAFLSALLKINYQGVASLEYESESRDPLPGSAESIGFERGVLNVI